MTIWEKLELFAGQLECSPAVYTWLYDAEGRLVKSNCPEESVMADAFRRFGCKEEMYHFGKDVPLYLGAPVGLQWIAERVPMSGAAADDCELGWWCLLLIVFPIALVFSESSMNSLQSVSIISAFPIGIVIILIIVSFFKDAKSYMKEKRFSGVDFKM